MNFLTLKEQITNKTLNNIYYFTGDERKIMNIYIHKMAETTHSKIVYVDGIKEIIGEIKQKSLLSVKTIYVINDDKEYMSNEKLWEKIVELNKNNILVFTFSSIDKRGKFYRHFKDEIISFDKLNDVTLARYVKSMLNLKDAYILKLIEICENDYGRILLEVNKIRNYSDNHNLAFEILMNKRLIYIPPKDAVFGLIDAILNRNPKLSYRLYEDCKEIGESCFVILLNLFNSTRITYQLQSYLGNGDICEITGLKQGQVYACQKRMYRYTNDELVDIMKLVQRIESNIKIGNITEDRSIDYLLANIFKK